jgi:hypothetical protein
MKTKHSQKMRRPLQPLILNPFDLNARAKHGFHDRTQQWFTLTSRVRNP